MMLLEDVVDVDDLEKEIDAGYINRRFHPAYPYAILNYSDKAQFDNRWTETIRNCRGLIYDYTTSEVIARGMPKFFNHGQVGAPEIAIDDIVHVADKADGSLGILYPTPDGDWAVATRGSFVSDQAIHATKLLDTYGLDFVQEHIPDTTILVEIVYPENRIVLNYEDTDELILLGAVRNSTGRFTPSSSGLDIWWYWPVAGSQSFGLRTYGEALAMPPRPNSKGLVLTRVSDGAMVKVKQEDYLRLHKAIFEFREVIAVYLIAIKSPKGAKVPSMDALSNPYTPNAGARPNEVLALAGCFRGPTTW